MAHQVYVATSDDAKRGPFRWECASCGRSGKYTVSKDAAEAGGKGHVKRFSPKSKNTKRNARHDEQYAVLQELLSLTYPSARD